MCIENLYVKTDLHKVRERMFMTHNSSKRNLYARCFGFILALIFVLSSLALIGCSSSKNENKMGASLKSEGEKISVEAPVSNDKRDVYLFALGFWQSPADIREMTPITKAKVKNKKATASFKVADGELSELLCKGFVFGMEDSEGQNYEPVSDVYYVTNPADVHKDAPDDPSTVAGNMKGLIGTPTQLAELGAKKTVVTVDIGRLIRGTGGEGAISLIYDGVSCHIDRKEIETLDAQIKAYTALGITVILETVQTRSYSELDPSMHNIAFEGAHGADGYAFNMLSRDGATRICALFDFITGRYTSGEYGRIGGIIVGRRVNSFANYYASGLDNQTAVKNYVCAVRTAYNLLASKDPEARVYAAIGNNWRFADVGGVSASEMLTTFANVAENGGDFFWQLCMEANPSDASNSAIWNDTLASNDPRFISPINLNAVNSVLASSPYQFEGHERNLLLNRFAIGGKDEESQAASYAYAYYKCLESGNVDGIIYATAVDGSGGTLKNGLYTSAGAAAGTPKKIGTVFQSVDNGKIGDATYIATLLGDKWSELYGSFSDSAINRRVTRAEDTNEHSSEVLKVLADFTDGSLGGFIPVSAVYDELRFSESWGRPVLYAELSPKFPGDSAGVVSSTISKKDLKDAGYLTFTAMINGAGEDIELAISLSGYDKSGIEVVYTARSGVRSGEWIEMYYDIEEFIKGVNSDTVTLSITARSASDTGSVNGLWLAQVTTEAPIKNEFPMWIIWTLVGLVLAGGLAAFIIWFNKNYTFVREYTPINTPPRGRKESK